MPTRSPTLSATVPAREDLAEATIALKVGGEAVTVTLAVPTGPAQAEDLLPALRTLTEVFVDRGVARVTREGAAVSCRMGCGACCRQLVPIAGSEARMLARVVAAMPPPRRARVRARFAAALAALDAVGLLTRLSDASATAASEGLAYLRLGIPCPFLEDESCSIYEDRPLVCRDYPAR